MFELPIICINCGVAVGVGFLAVKVFKMDKKVDKLIKSVENHIEHNFLQIKSELSLIKRDIENICCEVKEIVKLIKKKHDKR